jgi:predicted GIY-YIG superfamily endonuclease
MPQPHPFSYVYILTSSAHPANRYIGLTGDLRRRLSEHNTGSVDATETGKPWERLIVQRRVALALCS